jgi:hypothetical protein
LVGGIDHNGHPEPFRIHQAAYASFEAIASAGRKEAVEARPECGDWQGGRTGGMPEKKRHRIG